MIMLFPGTADGFFGPVCWTCIKASKHWRLNVYRQCGKNISCDLHMEHLMSWSSKHVLVRKNMQIPNSEKFPIFF